MKQTTKQCGKRTYHRDNCDALVRKTFVSNLGNTVALVGRHAFEWTVIVQFEGSLCSCTFNNRKAALAEYCKQVSLISFMER